MDARPNRTLALMWPLIFVFGCVLRLWHLGTPALSYDESYTLLLAKAHLLNLLRATAGDVHPPLFYLLEWVMVRAIGPHPWALRLLPAAFGVAGLWLARELARALGLSERAQLIGVGLMAVLPFQLHYSQDARMYTLLQALVVWALLAAVRRYQWQMCAALVLMLWTHNYGVIYWPILAALAFLRELPQPAHVSADVPSTEQARIKLVSVLAFVVPPLTFAPWAAVLWWQVQDLSGNGYWIVPLTLGQFIYPFYAFWWGVTLPTGWPEVASIATFAVLFFALFKAARLHQPGVLALAVMVIAPPVVAAVLSLTVLPLYLFRALIGVAVPMYLLVAWAITEHVDWKATAYVVAVCAVFTVAGWLNRGNLQILKGTSEQVQDYIAANAQAGDVIYHGNVSSLLGFAASGYPALPQYLMPVQPGSVGILTPQTRAALGFDEQPLERVPFKRAWLVWGAVPTIAAAEDAAIADVLQRYPHQQIINLDDIFTGDNNTVDGGVWLLWPSVNSSR